MRFPQRVINLSTTLNHAMGGKKGYTLCASMWEAKLEGRLWGRILVPITDKIFWFDPSHCYKSWKLRSR